MQDCFEGVFGADFMGAHAKPDAEAFQKASTLSSVALRLVLAAQWVGMAQTRFLFVTCSLWDFKPSFLFLFALGRAIVSMQVLAHTGVSPAATAMFEDSLRNLHQVI